MSDTYTDYAQLLDRFLCGEMSVESFQKVYLDRFKNETRKLDALLFDLLDGLFGDVDAFTTDSELLTENPTFYLDEAKLREKVLQVANRLSELKK